MRRLLQPLAIALAVVVIAVLCLASPYLAGVIGLLTAAVVAVDMLVFSRPMPPPIATSAEPTPETINVDLSRRP
jgi:hypothetical protein